MILSSEFLDRGIEKYGEDVDKILAYVTRKEASRPLTTIEEIKLYLEIGDFNSSIEKMTFLSPKELIEFGPMQGPMTEDQNSKYYILLKYRDEKAPGWKINTWYYKYDSYMLMECPKKHMRWILPVSFKNSRRCAACFKNDPELAKEITVEKLNQMGVLAIGALKSSKIRIPIICKRKHICHADSHDINRNRGICYKCTLEDLRIESEIKFHKRVASFGGEAKVIGKYINNFTRVACICPHGKDVNIPPRDSQIGCDICQCEKNKSATIVYHFLNEHYKVTEEKRYDWCRGIKSNLTLPFDFRIRNAKRVTIIVELDGGHHFKTAFKQPVEKRRATDAYKASLALENGKAVIRFEQPQVWNDRKEENPKWQEELLRMIEEAEPGEIYYMWDSPAYDLHKQDLENRIWERNDIVENEDSE